jgi:hypothetical protein
MIPIKYAPPGDDDGEWEHVELKELSIRFTDNPP